MNSESTGEVLDAKVGVNSGVFSAVCGDLEGVGLNVGNIMSVSCMGVGVNI